MKRVSFKVAKALKEAGYPPFRRDLSDCYGSVSSDVIAYREIFPTYLEVWLWLWREKGIRIREEITKVVIYNNSEIGYITKLLNIYNDPEEAIIAAIDYLVDNNLIK